MKPPFDLETSADRYLMLLHLLQSYDRQPRDVRKQTREQSEWATKVWARMRNARLFEIPGSYFGAIYQTMDRYTTEVVAGQEWQGYDREIDLPQKETNAHLDKISKSGRTIPFPSPLPFDHIFLSIRNPTLAMSDGMLISRAIDPDIAQGKLVHLWGTLLCSDGLAVEFLIRTDIRGEFDGMIFQPEYDGGEWTSPYDLNPWVLNTLVDAINENKVVTLAGSSFKEKWDWQKKAKRVNVKMAMPPPYYPVVLRSRLDDLTKKTINRLAHRRRFEYSHRFDVRGHERCRIMRGPFPLEPSLEAKLLQRGYKLFILNDLDAETYRLLLERGVARKRSDEWLAVKRAWVDAFVKGGESLPYIPSTRKLVGRRHLT